MANSKSLSLSDFALLTSNLKTLRFEGKEISEVEEKGGKIVLRHGWFTANTELTMDHPWVVATVKQLRGGQVTPQELLQSCTQLGVAICGANGMWSFLEFWTGRKERAVESARNFALREKELILKEKELNLKYKVE